jgi:hypothetical protein
MASTLCVFHWRLVPQVCDLLRDLLLNEDSDNADLVPEAAREELLWRSFTHLVLGGACCQYEVCVGGGGGWRGRGQGGGCSRVTAAVTTAQQWAAAAVQVCLWCEPSAEIEFLSRILPPDRAGCTHSPHT